MFITNRHNGPGARKGQSIAPKASGTRARLETNLATTGGAHGRDDVSVLDLGHFRMSFRARERYRGAFWEGRAWWWVFRNGRQGGAKSDGHRSQSNVPVSERTMSKVRRIDRPFAAVERAKVVEVGWTRQSSKVPAIESCRRLKTPRL